MLNILFQNFLPNIKNIYTNVYKYRDLQPRQSFKKASIASNGSHENVLWMHRCVSSTASKKSYWNFPGQVVLKNYWLREIEETWQIWTRQLSQLLGGKKKRPNNRSGLTTQELSWKGQWRDQRVRNWDLHVVKGELE